MMFTNKKIYTTVFLLFATSNSILPDIRSVIMMYSWQQSAYIAKILVLAQLFSIVSAVYTKDGVETMSTTLNPYFNTLRDNNFDTFAHTQAESAPWMNIRLPESSVIATVVLFNRPDLCSDNCIGRLKWTCIRIGNDALPINNPVCVGNIEKDGVYLCPSPMTGTNVGIIRTG